jgi:sec-independent protein translocase protein TatA
MMQTLALFGPLGGQELLLILLVLLVLFGGRKIPELARGLGEGIKNFRGAIREPEKDDEAGPDDDRSGQEKTP